MPVLIECMVPFFLVFESRKLKARELVTIAVLCAIGVAGRSAFFMLPQFKPVLDNDNDHSDDPSKWISAQDIPQLFPDMPCIVYTSRNHMKQKGNRSPSPRFHVAVPVEPITDPSRFTALMQRIHAAYPFFDDNALAAGRFFFGNPDTEVYIFTGSLWNTVVDRVTVYTDGRLMFYFKNGAKMKVKKSE